MLDKAYGGLIASLIDCNGVATAIASAFNDEGRAFDTLPAIRFVTGNLNIDYCRPTPINKVLNLSACIIETAPRKTIVEITLSENEGVCAKGRVVAVKLDNKNETI